VGERERAHDHKTQHKKTRGQWPRVFSITYL